LSPRVVEDNHFWFTSTDSLKGGIFIVLFSSKSDSCKDIHDQISPEHLKDSEWVSSKSSTAQQSNKADNNIDSQLELRELLNIVEISLSPEH